MVQINLLHFFFLLSDDELEISDAESNRWFWHQSIFKSLDNQRTAVFLVPAIDNKVNAFRDFFSDDRFGLELLIGHLDQYGASFAGLAVLTLNMQSAETDADDTEQRVPCSLRNDWRDWLTTHTNYFIWYF